MAQDVFISYSNKDKPIADGVCANLEADGIRCWIAPRDIAPGEDWPAAITKAISQSRIMVLVFSANSNSSEDVSRELILASNSKLVIIPFKIENIEPEPGKQYYLARTHWLDAMNPPTKEQVAVLVNRVKSILPATDPVGGKPDPEPPVTLPLGPVTKKERPGRGGFRWQYLLIPAALILLFMFAWFAFPSVLTRMAAGQQSSPTAIPQFTLTQVVPTPQSPQFTLTQIVPTPQSQYKFQDDFSDEASGWEVWTEGAAEKYYKNGEYVIYIQSGYSTNAYYTWSMADIEDLTDVVIEVDARYIRGQGAYGVIVDYQGETNFYFVEISPGNGSWDLVQMTRNGARDLVLWESKPAIRPGSATNHLRFELSKFPAFYVNDALMLDLRIPYVKGGIGLWAVAWDGAEFEVAFDNFSITSLP